MAAVDRLPLHYLNRPGQAVSVGRKFYPPGRRRELHDHEFPEIFWIESGSGLEVADGRPQRLVAGDLRFVSPETAHELSADADGAMVLVNVAFARDHAELLRPLVPDDLWPWNDHRPRHLDEAQQAFLAEWGRSLGAPEATTVDLAAFLMELIRRLRSAPAMPASALPPWLAEALEILDEPQRLALGVPELVRITGRGSAYISRIVRRHCRCTTIQLINRRRLAHLARSLRTTATPVADLAQQVGLANLSHCYDLFRRTYGVSPAVYRSRVTSSAR
jgi:AraC family cel operon transcriptional repressor